ncbi:hypothetical protein CW304_03075 [Bacillus sp. UFRGS-B20]|nr:hypothetical protein CW304_03075 [Bacillus sp. UFRGS-B20]
MNIPFSILSKLYTYFPAYLYISYKKDYNSHTRFFIFDIKINKVIYVSFISNKRKSLARSLTHKALLWFISL